MIKDLVLGNSKSKLPNLLKDYQRKLISESLEESKVIGLILKKLEGYGNRMAMATRYENTWEQISYEQIVLKAKRLASYLMKNGFDHTKKVLLISESINEYPVTLLALALTGSVIIPLDNKLTADEIRNIIEHSEPNLALSSSEYYKQMNIVCKSIKQELPLMSIDNKTPGLSSIFELSEDEDPDQVFPERKLDETLIISYTSGTTGKPKGVMLTPRNLSFQVEALSMNFDLTGARFLSILPMNHMFELTGGVLTVLASGGEIYCARTLLPTQLVEILKDKKITNMQCVPLVLEAFKNAIYRKIKKESIFKQKAFNKLLKIAPSLSLKYRKRLFQNIHQAFGGEFRYFVSGGAPLNAETYEFWNAVGIEVYEGYGLTETSPVLTVNPLGKSKRGSVGKAVVKTQIRIEKEKPNDRDGIIYARGPQIMKGYYKNKELTDKLIDADGWFNTGDIGHLDQEGYLFITGRAKNLIVLGGGKKVHSEEVESVLEKNELIEECAVIAQKSDRGESVVAIVVPKVEVQDQYDDIEDCQTAIMKELEEQRSQLADYKWPSSIKVSFNNLPRTTTKKVKRNQLQQFLH